ncbi:MAG: helicase-exonuclease AddAB subunit AddA [Defluviitaleaceae bacterium]|nr:helicase-exonuclease AddAB subunit AddA [Defluviitaleaceae bacterium]
MSKFTPAQETAVMCNAQEILVSAAAGSGKTYVLTERILRHISDGIDIDRLLVVTFTEAASAEMRERVTKKLQANPKLSHQAALLPIADISTIHSFCRKLVKEHFQVVELDPAFRVGDDAELSLVKSQVIDELFESEYARENNEDFLDLVDVYGGKTMDGRLDALVRGIYDFMESDPFPIVAAQRYAAFFNEDISDLDDTPWAKAAREELGIGLQGVLEGLRQAIEICQMPSAPHKYIARLEEERSLILTLLDVIDKPFITMYGAFQSITWGRLPSVTAKDMVDDEIKKRVQRIRDTAVKKRMKVLTQGIFFAPPEKMRDDLIAVTPRVKALMSLSTRFAEAYAAEKRARNILDFTDLEHFAIKILYPNGPEDMTPDPAHKLYHEVLIDEYQDSNEVQDLILSAVAERRFMVGDVKQSIYRFRRANPGLFIKKYKSFAAYTQNNENCVRIDLSHNFRSRPEVLNAVNFFFSKLMCSEVGEVKYDENAALYAGLAEYPILPINSRPQMQIELLDQGEETEFETDDEPISNVIAETKVIAKCIQEALASRKVWDSTLADFRPCQQGDIAILTRGLSTIAAEVIETLKNHGIDAIADMNAGFFQQQEIKVALSLLRIIDNPRQDIDLIAVLSSPIYAFTPDELYEISQSTKEAANFYDRLLAVESKNGKVQKFLKDLEGWRTAAVYMPISRLIGFIYDTTRYPAHVVHMTGGTIRQGNLRLLLERAIEFEETSLKGLFHFIHYIERLSTSGSIASASEPAIEGSNKVRLMTIHKSKGLEFPIVICAFLSKQFNIEDERRPVILHSEMGIGPYYVNSTLRTRSNTLARFSLARMTRRENLSEELRCLYVAMTRAQELLILTARCKNLEKSREKWIDNVALPLYYRIGARSYLDWIMPCLTEQYNESLFRITVHHLSDMPESEKNIIMPKALAANIKTNLLQPYENTQSLPSKLSISEIKRLYDITPDSTSAINQSPNFEPPEFIQAEQGITPMKMGSAIHTVVEHLDYHMHTTSESIELFLQELVIKNLLDSDDGAAISREKILEYTKSPIADRLRNAKIIYRETPFVLTLPAQTLYPEENNLQETILVHGIIDCHFEENGKIILLDFKSDNIPKNISLAKWAESHRFQLEIYKQALTQSTQMEVSEMLLYSFSRGQTVSL